MSIVSQESNPAPGSLQGEARVTGADQPRVAPGEIAIGVIIGRTSEDIDATQEIWDFVSGYTR